MDTSKKEHERINQIEIHKEIYKKLDEAAMDDAKRLDVVLILVSLGFLYNLTNYSISETYEVMLIAIAYSSFIGTIILNIILLSKSSIKLSKSSAQHFVAFNHLLSKKDDEYFKIQEEIANRNKKRINKFTYRFQIWLVIQGLMSTTLLHFVSVF
ncbi:hypothetical protein [Ekhidna sp.]|uniref:hypothetical protein n=1 Tax=Ekhidna sp. TaxID=2608089 RepID=UPI003CCBC68F